MSAVEYAWAEGRRWSLPAETVGEELERIREAHGRLDAAIVVSESRPKSSVLHDVIFHVSRDRASLLWYEERARALIRSLTIRVVDSRWWVSDPLPDSPAEPVRAFISVRPADDGEQRLSPYVEAREVRESPELSAQYRTMLMRRIAGLRRDLAAWDEFRAVVVAMDEVLAA